LKGKLVQFGAGNIGRSFIGQLFSRSGYEVVFVDVAERIIAELNSRGAYRVIVKRDGKNDEEIVVEGVRAVNGRDAPAVEREICSAEYIATSVGQQALATVLPVIASGLAHRFTNIEADPVDIIIAENIRRGAELFRQALLPAFPVQQSFDDMVGLVETSIGKMVPIMREEDIRRDPLWVFAEPYNTLIVHSGGFRNNPPQVEGMKLVDDIGAYVDRKLFIHNMGHAACAYFAYARDPSLVSISDAIHIPAIRDATREAMMQSASALHRRYPNAFTPADLEEHVRDLISRFGNRALGDTIHRVGRDLYRKLHREDRLVGAMLLAHRNNLPYDAIALAFLAALEFAAPGPDGTLLVQDSRFRRTELAKGLDTVLYEVCNLRDVDPDERAVMARLRELHRTQEQIRERG